jgi:hypothetical protein
VRSVEGFREDGCKEADGDGEGVAGGFDGGCDLSRHERGVVVMELS